MPRFAGVGTTIQLSVADLRRTTTLNPGTQQSVAVTESIKYVAQEFAKGSIDGTLTETPLCTEDGSEDESHMQFLGKLKNFPFYMVQAGKNFFHLRTKEKRNRRSFRVLPIENGEGESASIAINGRGEQIGVETSTSTSNEPKPDYKPPCTPHALCLTVFLSKMSFVRSQDKTTIFDVKIDVYLNGELCGSRFVPRRCASEKFSMTEHIVRFTGRRIGRLVEKPFVLVPSGQNPNGSFRQNRRGELAYAGAQQRWDDLASALMAEADRIGQDENGERPVLGEYLESLAQLSMPKEIEKMQKAGSPKFGVLDVAITWGNGSKKGPNTPYSIEPTPIRSQNDTATENVQLTDQLSVQGIPKTPENPIATPKSRSQALANAKSIDDLSGTSPSTLALSSISVSNHHKVDTAASYKRPYRALSLDEPVKRSRGYYHDVITTRRTQEEEFQSITTAAVSETNAGYNPTFLARARKGKASYAPAADGSPSSSAPLTSDLRPAQDKVVGMKYPAVPGPVTGFRDWGSPRMQNGERDFHFLTPVRPPVSTPGVDRSGQFPTTQTNTAALDDYFVTPALSEDCVITYAPCGVLRNVAAARGWVFSEEGVIMGARFIVGG
ncbi:hypothetical protein BDR22DRAFT_599332 [Usnea florida]